VPSGGHTLILVGYPNYSTSVKG